MEVILRLDVAMESRDLSAMERKLRRTLKQKLLGLCALERSIARQRSRLLHLKEGDGNTRLFHQQASHRQRKNVMRSVSYDGRVYTGQEDVASAVDDISEAYVGIHISRTRTELFMFNTNCKIPQSLKLDM